MPHKTVFHSEHVKANAKIIDFGGWEMPIQYSGLMNEHHAVRNSVGLFDVSHMGEVWIEGEQALAAVRYLLSNSIDIVDGQAQYSCLCNHEGGIIDDVIIYRFHAEKFLLCVNASNQDKDTSWLIEQNPYKETVQIRSASAEYAQIAVQGRYAEKTVQRLTNISLEKMGDYHFAPAEFAGIENCIIARTGYTGEDGFEVFIPNEKALPTWQATLAAGSDYGIQPIGLGARDTLRLEARMNLYGNDMTDDTKPHESGVFWAVDVQKTDFIGKKAIVHHKENEWTHRLVGLTLEKRIPRSHCSVLSEGEVVGTITSGTRSPSLGVGIALARVPRALSRVGTPFEIDIRGRRASAVVVKGPFFKRNY